MVLTLTLEHFKNLNKVIEASRRAIASAPEGEMTLAENSSTDHIEWDTEEVRITLGT